MTNQSPLLTVDPRGCIFSVVGSSENIPDRVIDTFRAAGAMEAVIVGGGVKGFAKEDVEAMLPWVLGGFKNFRGVAVSGGTAYFERESGKFKSEIVTAIPAALAAAYKCIAFGTFPRVEEFAVDREFHFLFTDTYGAVVDDRYHHICAIQKNASDVMGWDGDLAQRFEILKLLEDWTTVYLIINGGAVTRDEAYLALESNIPVVVARGSGREADALVAAVENDDFSLTAKEQREKAGDDAAKMAIVDGIVEKCKATLAGRKHLVHVVDYGDADALNAVLKSLGFFSSENAAS